MRRVPLCLCDPAGMYALFGGRCLGHGRDAFISSPSFPASLVRPSSAKVPAAGIGCMEAAAAPYYSDMSSAPRWWWHRTTIFGGRGLGIVDRDGLLSLNVGYVDGNNIPS